MATQKQGFLDQLGVGNVDERAIARQQMQQNTPTSQAFNQGARLGYGARPLLGAGIGAVNNLITKRGRGFLKGVKEGVTAAEQVSTANELGITPEELQGRRKIREMVSTFQDDGSFEGRKRLNKGIAKIATEYGLTDVLGNVLRNLQSINEEEQAFAQLQAQTTEVVSDSEYPMAIYKGKPITVKRETQNGREGGTFQDPKTGETVFVPWGTELVKYNPSSASSMKRAKGINDALKTYINQSEAKDFRTLVSANKESLRKFGRVMGDVKGILMQYGEDVAAGSIGTSGEVSSFVNSAVNTIRGTLSNLGFNLGADEKGGWKTDDGGYFSGLGVLKEEARAGEGIWRNIKLPDYMTATGQQAANYRAQLMELAYMAARIAEPSNRGLSDNDIKNALIRLAGDNNDPHAVLERFGTIVADGHTQVYDQLDMFSERISPEGTVWETLPEADARSAIARETRRYLGGKALDDYDQLYEGTLEGLNAYVDDNGHFRFRDLSIGIPLEGEGEVATEDAQMPEWKKQMLSTQQSNGARRRRARGQ